MFYSLSCDATDASAIARLREAKQCKRPFAVVAPSKKWIYANFDVPRDLQDHLEALPNNAMFMLKLKNKKAVAENVHNGSYIVGVRIPNHSISDFAAATEKPLVLTAANITGKESARDVKGLDERIRGETEFFVDDGKITERQPLTVFNQELLAKHRIRLS